VNVLIVGAGFAGIGMAIALRQAGITDFAILERSGEVGGTWRDNHYPGAACDVESHLYSFSFEPNPDWTRTFAGQAEILEYMKRCAGKYGVYPFVRFHTSVRSARWDEGQGRWHVELDDGVTLTARVLVSGCGGLSRPAYPDIVGLDRFAGKIFHSARWDHDFSLDGKRVAVIGTGASAIQIVPKIAPRVERLSVYQRTPPWILPKPDRAIHPFERALFRRLPLSQALVRGIIYWQREALALGFVTDTRLLKLLERVARRYLKKSVKDPALRDKLSPSYSIGCKRILPTNDYYPALQRPNVELVTDAIQEVTRDGILTTDGKERRLDAIVLATGFQVAEHVAPFDIEGREGRSLKAEWRDTAEAYLGTTVSGFPNLFFIIGPNTGLGHSSMIVMIEAQIAYIRDAIETMRREGLKLVAVRPAPQTIFNTRIHARLANTIWASGCKSWYQTRSGKNTTLWPGFTFEFRRRTRRFDPTPYELVALGEQSSPPSASPSTTSDRGTPSTSS
jgi:cation diffusion facilitator CzcD-associated flavoprotein CzcO